MVFFLSQEENFSSRLSDKAPLNRAFLPPLRAAFIRVFSNRTRTPFSPPRGGREPCTPTPLGEASGVSLHKVHEIRDNKGAFLGRGRGTPASRMAPGARRHSVGIGRMTPCVQIGKMVDLRLRHVAHLLSGSQILPPPHSLVPSLHPACSR